MSDVKMSEAERLAQWLESDACDLKTPHEAAAELRRLAAVERELEAHRLYARALCKAVDAATDFAGTVAGGASWWDDVWADHAAALDRARERISNAQGGEQ